MSRGNPLLEAVLDRIHDGRHFDRIHPSGDGDDPHGVVFYFADGTEEVVTLRCDRANFLAWWEATIDYLRLAGATANAFADPRS